VEPALLAVLLPSSCLEIRLEESESFKKKDWFYQMMSRQGTFKNKREAEYFHGEFRAQGYLW